MIYIIQEYEEPEWVSIRVEGTNKELLDFMATELRDQHPSSIYRVIEKPWEPDPYPPTETASSPTEIIRNQAS